MIQSKEDLKLYLKEDALANIKQESCSWISLKINVFYRKDNYRFYQYLKVLRHYEYALNCMSGVLGKIYKLYYKVKHHRLGAKINVDIQPNMVGYGFRVPHLVGGVIINCKSIGNWCTANAGVIVGNNNKGGMAVIGDHVDLTIGSKVIGGVHIGNNVIVAPNSVVVKDVPNNAIVSGIPAKILKYKEDIPQ